MFLYEKDFGLFWMLLKLSEFTINNGCYPDVIEMTHETLAHYLDLLAKVPKLDKLTFMGIKIKLNKLNENKDSN